MASFMLQLMTLLFFIKRVTSRVYLYNYCVADNRVDATMNDCLEWQSLKTVTEEDKEVVTFWGGKLTWPPLRYN